MYPYWSMDSPAGLLLLFALPLVVAGAEESADRIVLRKAKRELTLWRDGKVIRTYRVSLGRTPAGAKDREGDGKTPEGSYTISGRNRASKFHLSLRISYPERRDRERAALLQLPPGGDIMIHGLPNGQDSGEGYLGSDWTEGCIAVTNREIEEIWRLVPNGTPIRIEP